MDRIEYIKQNLSIEDYFNEVMLPDLEDYYDGVRRIEFDNRFIRCPFHNEEEGSFKVYGATNSFYCFGCGRGGDVIAMHREHLLVNKQSPQKFDVVENFLYNLAKDIGNGKSKVQVAKLKEENKEIINSKQDLLRYTIEQNKFIKHIKSKSIEPSKRVKLMGYIAMYRDCILEQEVLVADAIKELREIVIEECKAG